VCEDLEEVEGFFDRRDTTDTARADGGLPIETSEPCDISPSASEGGRLVTGSSGTFETGKTALGSSDSVESPSPATCDEDLIGVVSEEKKGRDEAPSDATGEFSP